MSTKTTKTTDTNDAPAAEPISAAEPAISEVYVHLIKKAVLDSGPISGQSHVEHASALITALALVDAAAAAPAAPAAPAEPAAE